MNKAQEKIMMQKAQEYANKQGDAEYESSLEDFIEGFKQAFALYNVVGQSEQLKPKQQICYKSNEPCKYDCSGLCKESY